MNCIFTAIVIAMVSCLFTSIYFHRSMAHSSVSLNVVVRNIMRLHLMMFTGIRTKVWVAMHRVHHRFADQPEDAHSPRQKGKWHVVFATAYYYHQFAQDRARVEKYSRGVKPELVDAIPIVGFYALGGLALLAYCFGFWQGFAMWILQGVLYYLVQSTTNAFTHSEDHGYATFNNTARNVQWLAWLTFGDAFQNNHHQYAARPYFAFRPDEFDPGWILIEWLVFCKLAKLRNHT